MKLKARWPNTRIDILARGTSSITPNSNRFNTHSCTPYHHHHRYPNHLFAIKKLKFLQLHVLPLRNLVRVDSGLAHSRKSHLYFETQVQSAKYTHRCSSLKEGDVKNLTIACSPLAEFIRDWFWNDVLQEQLSALLESSLSQNVWQIRHSRSHLWEERMDGKELPIPKPSRYDLLPLQYQRDPQYSHSSSLLVLPQSPKLSPTHLFRNSALWWNHSSTSISAPQPIPPIISVKIGLIAWHWHEVFCFLPPGGQEFEG